MPNNSDVLRRIDLSCFRQRIDRAPNVLPVRAIVAKGHSDAWEARCGQNAVAGNDL